MRFVFVSMLTFCLNTMWQLRGYFPLDVKKNLQVLHVVVVSERPTVLPFRFLCVFAWTARLNERSRLTPCSTR